jgi:glycosyltransferase involved in cell wall biosynthesis
MENKQPFLSIIVVCLNPGDKLRLTLDSILLQTFTDYEIIIKDGLSVDGSLDTFLERSKHQNIYVFREKDSGIYDAMNQAVQEAAGRFVYFLNCGDTLFDGQVLEKVKENITKDSATYRIFYGNVLEALTGQEVSSNPQINRFACYRNLPCHQSCFYQRELLTEHPFEIKYQIRADQEHFMWCVLDKGVKSKFIPVLVANYEGAGFSEAKENPRASLNEHKEITRKYMPKAEIFRYRLIMLVTLAPLRTALSRSRHFAAVYHRIKKRWYRKL